MKTDLWHYPRTALAQQVINMFNTSLSSALVFFAPRRMGKTEFLRKDIQPLATKQSWQVFYFSFLDADWKVKNDFSLALLAFAEKIGAIKSSDGLFSRVRKLGGAAAGIRADLELFNAEHTQKNIKDIIAHLAEYGRILLLMDEIQALAQSRNNEHFIAGLRTALDINKDQVKVIFTGSSREGLRRMFSQASAPFFHFGQNLPFPELSKEFVEHLAKVFQQVTSRQLDIDVLWDAFEKMQKVPQLMRALIERLALNPNHTISKATDELLANVFDEREFTAIWKKATALEKFLLQTIATETGALFSEAYRERLAKELGEKQLMVSTVQSAVRTLQRKHLIGKLPERGQYFIDDPNFKSWLLSM